MGRGQLSADLTQRIAADFTEFLNVWHSAPETYDNDLDAQIHGWYRDILSDKSRNVWPPRDIPYFSPSSANADRRGLYEKLRGAKKDAGGQPPYQGRWTRIGTAIGDVIQRDILFAEKHYAKHAGVAPRFKFERNDRGEPMFEDFAKRAARLSYNGADFAIYGTCDGIMTYVTEDGEQIRVGLEIKSKQTTAAQTSDYSQRNGPKEDHVKQTVCYSLMYGTDDAPLDYYVILYVNASKKSWVMTDDEFAKNPDIKAHCIEITDEMRTGILESFAEIVHAAKDGRPPTLSLDSWTFNGFKTACARSLSDEEVTQLERTVAALQRSGLPEFKKRQAADALAQIKTLRGAV